MQRLPQRHPQLHHIPLIYDDALVHPPPAVTHHHTTAT